MPLYGNEAKIKKLHNFLSNSVDRVRTTDVDFTGCACHSHGHDEPTKIENEFKYPSNPAMVNKMRSKKPLNFVY